MIVRVGHTPRMGNSSIDIREDYGCNIAIFLKSTVFNIQYPLNAQKLLLGSGGFLRPHNAALCLLLNRFLKIRCYTILTKKSISNNALYHSRSMAGL